MNFGRLLEVVDRLADLDVRIGGGWGVDVLAGRVTRPHHDVDAFVPVKAMEEAITRHTAQGFVPVGPAEPWRTVVEAPDGRRVDLGGLTFRDGGDSMQIDDEGDMELFPQWAWTSVVLDDRRITCLTAEAQRRKHRGYGYRPGDAQDLAAIAFLADPPRYDPTIRPATMDDADLLPLIESAADRVLATQLPGPLPAESGERGADPAGATLVAGRPPVGYARMELVDGRAHLASLAVLPEYGSEGLGGRLVGAATEWARERRLPQVSLTTFVDVVFNAPWYRRLGFRELRGPFGPELTAIWDDERDLRRIAERTVMVLDL